MQSLFAGARALTERDALSHIRADLPIYIFSGDKDPVNGGLVWLEPLIERYRKAGVRDVTVDFYKDGRHEMLNETNRAEVVANLSRWIDRVVAR
jgi:alpha-beta hydrolase superfamily lysophospholipase